MSGARLAARGANAKVAARLPALQAVRVDDPQVQKAIEAIREWIEVRLGSRGDPFERAVTLRDMEQTLAPLRADLAALAALKIAAVTALPALQQGAFVQVGDELYYCNGKAWKRVTVV